MLKTPEAVYKLSVVKYTPDGKEYTIEIVFKCDGTLHNPFLLQLC